MEEQYSLILYKQSLQEIDENKKLKEKWIQEWKEYWKTLKKKPINWYWEREMFILNKHLLKKRQEWFAQSDLKRELMEKLWHPANTKKLSGRGFDDAGFDDDQKKENTEWDWVNQW